MALCKRHFNFVSKIWARGLKLGQLIGYDEQITWLTFEQILSNFSWVMALCKRHFNFVSKIWARGLKLGQLIGDDRVDYLLNFWAKSSYFTALQIWPYLGAIKCWRHSVLQTPALSFRELSNFQSWPLIIRSLFIESCSLIFKAAL